MPANRIDGTGELKRQLTSIKRKITEGSTTAVRAAADDVKRDAQAHAPVRTGALSSAIETVKRSRTTARVGVFDEKVDYAPYIEFGTSTQEEQPFLTPAAEAERKRLGNRVADAVQDRLA